MRLIKAALLVTILAVVAPAAHAGPITFGLGGGIASPTGDFGDFAKLGFNGNVYADYWVSPMFAIGADVDGSFFSGKDDVKDGLKAAFPAFPDPKVSANIIGGGIHGKYAFAMEGAVHPYLEAGVGMYNVAAKIEDSDPLVNIDDSETDFGFHGGIGADFKGSESMKWGIDAKYWNVSTDPSSSFFTAGLHLTFSTTGTTK